MHSKFFKSFMVIVCLDVFTFCHILILKCLITKHNTSGKKIIKYLRFKSVCLNPFLWWKVDPLSNLCFSFVLMHVSVFFQLPVHLKNCLPDFLSWIEHLVLYFYEFFNFNFFYLVFFSFSYVSLNQAQSILEDYKFNSVYYHNTKIYRPHPLIMMNLLTSHLLFHL